MENRIVAWAGVLLAVGCAPRRPPDLGPPGGTDPRPPIATPVPDRQPLDFGPGGLPGVPLREGPLALTVVYPPEGTAVSAADSSFLFGSTGNGRAALTINGTPVRVWPNGSWLGWIALPSDSVMTFRLRATVADSSVELIHRVRRAPRFVSRRTLWIDTTSFSPGGTVWWPQDEALPLSVRATPGAKLRLLLPDGRSVLFQSFASGSAVSEGLRAFDREVPTRYLAPDRYAGALRGLALGVPMPDLLAAANSIPPTEGPILEAVLDRDTVRVRWPLRLTLLPDLATVVTLDDDPDRTGTTDGLTAGRALPGGTYHWFFPTGTVAPVTARRNGDLRLGLSAGSLAWVPLADARRVLDAGPLNPAVAGSIVATPNGDRTVVRIPLDRRVPYQVEQADRGLVLRLYQTVGNPNWIRYGTGAGPLYRITWQQAAADELEFSLDLNRPLWGYRIRWDVTDLIVELRGPPAIHRDDPLRGRRIVVDPGHPPGGSTGPSGLREAEANLAVARRLKELLVAAGGSVIMTREADTPVDLWPRVAQAEREDADLLISIHNNALPDGVDPFRNHGTSTYYFHPNSLDLARAVQEALVQRLGLPDLGVGRGDLALVRGTWMPSVLVEGLFMMLPEQEAALGSVEGQSAYAAGVYRGILKFLTDFATRRTP